MNGLEKREAGGTGISSPLCRVFIRCISILGFMDHEGE